RKTWSARFTCRAARAIAVATLPVSRDSVMATTLHSPSVSGHLLRAEIKPRMAKARVPDLRKTETTADAQWNTAVGRVIEQVQGTLTLQEFASKLGRSERQVARWKSGEEHAQLATIFAVEEFRLPLVVGLARLVPRGISIETVMRIA